MFQNKRFKFAFTMSELLITTAVIGVIVAFAIPIFYNALPSQEEQMAKKISYLVEQIALQMYDNETFYPRTSDVAKQGFLNTDAVSVGGTSYSGNTKFCQLFARQFNLSDKMSVTCPDTISSETPSFRSVDGVDWWVPKTKFTESGNDQVSGHVKIKVDVNGYDKGDNCAQGTSGCSNPDIFYYYIKANGSVTLSDPTAFEDRTYEIIRNIVTKDDSGNVVNTPGGTLEIAPINADGTDGTFSSEDANFTNLAANSNYILRARPNADYVTNWGTRNTADASQRRYGYKKVRTNNVKTVVNLEFKKIKKYCIKLKVNCNNSIRNCVDRAECGLSCSYNYVGENRGYYKRVSDSLDNYDYAGPFQGNYNYECSDAMGMTIGTGSDDGYLTACGLEPGDYQLSVEPKTGWRIVPNIDFDEYTQNVRLGTSDLSDFEVTILDY